MKPPITEEELTKQHMAVIIALTVFLGLLLLVALIVTHY